MQEEAFRASSSSLQDKLTTLRQMVNLNQSPPYKATYSMADLDAIPSKQGSTTMSSNKNSPNTSNKNTFSPSNSTAVLNQSLNSTTYFQNQYENEEISLLKEHSRFLYSKIVALEHTVNDHVAKNRFLEEELDQLREAHKQALQQLHEYQEKLKTIERLHERDMIQKEGLASKMQIQLEGLQQKLESTERAKVLIESARKELEIQQKDYVRQISQLQQQGNQAKHETALAQQEMDKLQREKKQMVHELDQAKQGSDKQLKQAQEKIHALKQAMDESLKRHAKEKETNQTQYQDKIQQMNQQVQQFHVQMEQVKQQVADLLHEKTNTDAACLQYQQKCRFLQSKLDNVQDMLVQQKTQYSVVHQSYFQLLKEKEKFEKKDSSLQTQVDQMSQALQEMEYQHAMEMEQQIDQYNQLLSQYDQDKKQLTDQVSLLQQSKSDEMKQLSRNSFEQEDEMLKHVCKLLYFIYISKIKELEGEISRMQKNHDELYLKNQEWYKQHQQSQQESKHSQQQVQAWTEKYSMLENQVEALKQYYEKQQEELHASMEQDVHVLKQSQEQLKVDLETMAQAHEEAQQQADQWKKMYHTSKGQP